MTLRSPTRTLDTAAAEHRRPENQTSKEDSAGNDKKDAPIWVIAGGFFICMVTMELALEGANNAFPDFSSLPYAVTLFQFGSCFLLPLVISKGESLATFPRTASQSLPYISLSLVVFGSTCLASMSVRYVSYMTKVVFKSGKLIPTMIVAAFLQRENKYGVLDYMAALLLCAGAAGYTWGKGGVGDHQDTFAGTALLLVSVFCDAFTPNIQQRLMSPPAHGRATLPNTMIQYSSPRAQSGRLHTPAKLCALILPPHGGGLGISASALMTNANGVGCIILFLFMATKGSLMESLGAAMSEPWLLTYLTIIGMSLAIAVFCYTRLIEQSGSVVAVAVATLRKVVTVVLSYVVYPKPLSATHAVSACFVIGGIVLSYYAKQFKRGR